MKMNYTLSLLKIPVSNIVRTAAFYRDVLGFEPVFAAEEYGWAQLQAGELALALYRPGMGGGEGQVGSSTGFHLALAAEHFDALKDVLCQHDALVDDMVHQGEDGSSFVEVCDPDGNTLKIMRVSEAQGAKHAA